MKTLITKHATKRLRKRLGLRKKAHKRHIIKVLTRGVIEAYDRKKHILYVLYDSRKYIFEDYKGKIAILITVFPRERQAYAINRKDYISPLTQLCG
jgi:hypothetical protein